MLTILQNYLRIFNRNRKSVAFEKFYIEMIGFTFQRHNVRYNEFNLTNLQQNNFAL